ncbi:hypothetical protein [Staphylococcus hominis]|nr:hypothetical protein [Staphylococcus hominis]
MKQEKGRRITVHLEPSEALKSEVTYKDYFKSMTQLFTYTKKVQVVRKK